MRARRPSSAAMLVALAAVLLGAGGVTATLGVSRGTDEGLVVFSAPGEDAFRLSVAASADSRWLPTAEDWRPGGGRRNVVPLGTDGGPLYLHPGGAVTVYLFIRNASAELSGAVTMSVVPPLQQEAQDEFFDHLCFRAVTEGREVLEGTGRVAGLVDRELSAGDVRRVSLTVALSADAPPSLIDRLTGVRVHVHAENR
ncbi:hypothetical protein [Microbacterium laevaniformans]|uniref:hypothetical protein n=1 Tax=Microbacterium laevaniformans TaxID=36807 RepID=UPI003631555C